MGDQVPDSPHWSLDDGPCWSKLQEKNRLADKTPVIASEPSVC